eukprot:1161860-Prymnesium_polylepis.1
MPRQLDETQRSQRAKDSEGSQFLVAAIAEGRDVEARYCREGHASMISANAISSTRGWGSGMGFATNLRST